MCRLLMFTGSNEGLAKLLELTELLVEASCNDPFLFEATGGRSSSHGDGWGYALSLKVGGSVRTLYYRTSKRVWLSEEKEKLLGLMEGLKEAERYYGLIHSRKAGRTEPVGDEHNHPYRYVVDGQELFFAHNGGVNKQALAEVLGFEKVSEVTDSFLAGLFIAQRIGKGRRLEEAYRELAGYTKSALNTGLLHVDMLNNTATLYVSSLIVQREPAREKYYALFTASCPGLAVVLSSTISALAEERRVLSAVGVKSGFFKLEDQGLREIATCRCST